MSSKPILLRNIPYSAFVCPMLITKTCGYQDLFCDTERKRKPRERKPGRGIGGPSVSQNGAGGLQSLVINIGHTKAELGTIFLVGLEDIQR